MAAGVQERDFYDKCLLYSQLILNRILNAIDTFWSDEPHTNLISSKLASVVQTDIQGKEGYECNFVQNKAKQNTVTKWNKTI